MNFYIKQAKIKDGIALRCAQALYLGGIIFMIKLDILDNLIINYRQNRYELLIGYVTGTKAKMIRVQCDNS